MSVTVQEARDALDGSIGAYARVSRSTSSGLLVLAKARAEVTKATDALVAAVREEAVPFLSLLLAYGRGSSIGGQVVTSWRCCVCHEEHVSGSTAHCVMCDACHRKLVELLKKARG
jgi:hypothetical protein